jgi:hypothetical protein
MYDPERLKFYMQKRIQTTMIGALARIEESFGYLWGHDKDGELTNQEEKFADLWDFTRNQILNYGNNQIRGLKDDFHKYGGVFQNKYHYKFHVPKDENPESRKD